MILHEQDAHFFGFLLVFLQGKLSAAKEGRKTK
jgi:hypothetical protein